MGQLVLQTRLGKQTFRQFNAQPCPPFSSPTTEPYHTLPLPHTSRPYRQRSAHSICHHNVGKYPVSNNHQLLFLDRNSERRKIRAYRFDARIRRLGRVVSQHGNSEMVRDGFSLSKHLSVGVASLGRPCPDLACIVFRTGWIAHDENVSLTKYLPAFFPGVLS